MNIFVYDNERHNVLINEAEILLIPEFKQLINRDSDRAFREFTYMWLMIDWKSFYRDFTELERHQASLEDALLTQEEFDDPLFRLACRKYQDILNSNQSLRLLYSVHQAIDSVILYFDTLDATARDEATGKYLTKTKDIIDELKRSSDLLDLKKDIEDKVKKDLTTSDRNTARGGVSASPTD